MNKTIITGIIVAASQVVCLTSANAYDPWFMGGVGYGIGMNAYGAGGGWGGAQTPYSAQANGMANVIRSQGMYNEYTSRAAVNYQQAQKQFIENQATTLAARQTARRAIHAEKLQQNEEARAQLAKSEEFMDAHRPPPLSTSQVDPSTGKLNWPSTLRMTDFDAQRKAIDDLFVTRAKYGPTADNSTQIALKAGELKDALRTHITKVPLPEYSESRQFLDNMVSTAR